MRIAISGVGLRAAHVLPLMAKEMADAEFVGYVDPAPQYLDRLPGGTEMLGFATVPKMLEATSPDLLCVMSPNHCHLDDIRAGLDAGVRIFTEKPVVISQDETFALAELLADHGPDRLMVGLVLRYSQHMRDLRAALDAGWIGDIASMEANEHIPPWHGAFFMRDWRRKTDISGGFMLEKCCHDLDIYNMIAGARPVAVASFGGRKSFVPQNAPETLGDLYTRKGSIWNSADDPFRGDGDIIDHQSALLEYETGATLAFHTNINTPDDQRRFCVIGSRGMAEGDFVRGYLNVTDAATSERRASHDYSGDTALKGAHYGADELMVRDIVAHLEGRLDRLPVSIVDAMTAGVVALATDEARMSRRIVDLAPVWKRLDALGLT